LSHQTRAVVARSGNQREGKKPSRQSGKKSLKELLARKRLEKLSTCGIEGHIAVGYDRERNKTFAVYRPHTCGSLFCPYCGKRKRYQVLGKYEDVLKALAEKSPTVFITLTIPNTPTANEGYEKISKALQKLYDFRLFRPKVLKKVRKAFFEELREYRANLKRLQGEGKLTAKEVERKVKTQALLFKRFVNRWRKLPEAKKLKFGQLFPALWVFELTGKAGNFHPHWHGIAFGEIPKLLITVLWKMATNGEAYITDVRAIKGGKKAVKQVINYVRDYVADGFIDIQSELSEDVMLEVEIALHGRRKVRAWGFDLIKGNNSDNLLYQTKGSTQTKSSIEWRHIYRETFALLKKAGKNNLHDFYKAKREARKKEERIPYIVLEWKFGERWFGDDKAPIFIGYMTPDGLIEIEPFHLEHRELWEQALEQLFAYGKLEVYEPSDEVAISYEMDLGLSDLNF